MKRIQLAILAFSLALIATNWFSSISYDRTGGITEQSFRPASLGLIFSGVAVLYLGRLAYRNFRTILGEGLKIKKEKSLFSVWPIACLLPLLFHSHRTIVTKLEDGTILTRSSGYGTDLGTGIFLLGALAIVLFQVVAELEAVRDCLKSPFYAILLSMSLVIAMYIKASEDSVEVS